MSTFLFLSTYRSRLDEEFRVWLPTRWKAMARAAEVTEVILFPFPNYIYVAFKPEAEIFRELETQSSAQRAQVEPVVQARVKVRLDRQGRFVVPERFRYGPPHLGREVVLIGVRSAVEIWTPEGWAVEDAIGTARFWESARQAGL